MPDTRYTHISSERILGSDAMLVVRAHTLFEHWFPLRGIVKTKATRSRDETLGRLSRRSVCQSGPISCRDPVEKRQLSRRQLREAAAGWPHKGKANTSSRAMLLLHTC